MLSHNNTFINHQAFSHHPQIIAKLISTKNFPIPTFKVPHFCSQNVQILFHVKSIWLAPGAPIWVLRLDSGFRSVGQNICNALNHKYIVADHKFLITILDWVEIHSGYCCVYSLNVGPGGIENWDSRSWWQQRCGALKIALSGGKDKWAACR